MLFDLSNLPYWIFLGLGVFLYLFVILSGGGDDDADFDADADMDMDADMDADVDTHIDHGHFHLDGDAESEFSALTLLGWFGLGKAPLLILLATDFCLWGLLGWMLNVAIASPAFVPRSFIDGLVLIVSLGLTLVLGGVISRPIGQVFASFGEDASGDRLIGCIGTVSSVRVPRIEDGEICQIDVLDPARNLVTVNAALPHWVTITPQRGDKVLVIDRQDGVYLVLAKDSPDQEQWFTQTPRIKDSPSS